MSARFWRRDHPRAVTAARGESVGSPTTGADGYDFSKAIWLPEHREPVTLFFASGEKAPGRVVERRGNSLLVALLLALGPRERRLIDGLVLEYANPTGRVRITGVIKLVRSQDGDLVRIDDAVMLAVLQERAYERVNVALPVLISAGSTRLETETVDVSGGGLLLTGPSSLALGEEVEFELTIASDTAPIVGAARVVRFDNEGRPAVEISSISVADRWRLVRFALACQRGEAGEPHRSGRTGSRSA